MEVEVVFEHKGQDKCFCTLSKSGILRAFQFVQKQAA